MNGVGALPYRERVVTFGGDRSLVGILTLPAGPPMRDRPTIVLLNSGVIHRIGVHRLHVHLARELARKGFLTFRFDLSGIGDSDPFPDGLSIRDAAQTDIADALAYLTQHCEAEGFVLVGLCSGAYDAFTAAGQDPRIEGAVLIDLPGEYRDWRHHLHHYQRRILRFNSWHRAFSGRNRFLRRLRRFGRAEALGNDEQVGFRPALGRERMTQDLDTVLERGSRLLVVFSAGLEEMYNHRSQFRRIFPRAASHNGLEFVFFHEADHTFSAENVRGQLIHTIVKWAEGFRQ